MLPDLASLNTKLFLVAIIAAVVVMIVVGQRIRISEYREEITELRKSKEGCQVAVEVQALAARADAERLNALSTGAANAARATIEKGKQEKRGAIAPGTGSGVMNKWLENTGVAR